VISIRDVLEGTPYRGPHTGFLYSGPPIGNPLQGTLYM
jgi:hypothetical protein